MFLSAWQASPQASKGVIILLRRIVHWFERTFLSKKEDPADRYKSVRKPPVLFSEVTIVASTPRNTEVNHGAFYLVDTGNKPKWVMFLCPCGCGHVITLSLRKIHDPHWKLNIEAEGRPTLYPSVWQKTDCYSHFWLRDGRIYWCEGTGNPSPYR